MNIIKLGVSTTIFTCLFACVQPEEMSNLENNKSMNSENKSIDSIVCEYAPEYSDKTNPVSFCKHYLSGKLIRDGLFLNEKTPLSYHYFYDSIGNVKTIREFCTINDDSSRINNIIEFDNNGDTLYSKSNFYTIKLLKDTIYINQPIDIEVELVPFFKISKAEVMIEKFTHPDSLWVAPLDNYKTQLTLSPLDSAGRYEINGMIREVNSNPEGDYRARDLWITHSFSVYD